MADVIEELEELLAEIKALESFKTQEDRETHYASAVVPTIENFDFDTLKDSLLSEAKEFTFGPSERTSFEIQPVDAEGKEITTAYTVYGGNTVGQLRDILSTALKQSAASLVLKRSGEEALGDDVKLGPLFAGTRDRTIQVEGVTTPTV